MREYSYYRGITAVFHGRLGTDKCVYVARTFREDGLVLFSRKIVPLCRKKVYYKWRNKVRTRKEIEKQCMSRPISFDSRGIEEIKIELLLDIRELLTNDSEYIKRLNLARVKIISHEQVEDEMAEELLGDIMGKAEKEGIIKKETP